MPSTCHYALYMGRDASSKMSIEKKPFVSYTLDEEKDQGKSRTFTVRINEQEAKWLEEAKEIFDISSDSQILKELAWLGRNVLHGHFRAPFLKYLFKKDRKRLSDFKNI